MQCYTELIAPSAVTHAIALPFLHANAKNLVVTKTNLLQIFRLGNAEIDRNESDHIDASSQNAKLVLIAEYPLSGTTTALAAIKLPSTKSGGDAVLISFKDAKLSLIEWDPENYKISTISIHYYEGENVVDRPFGEELEDGDGCVLTVDPQSRCAALRFGRGGGMIAVLPFRQVGDDLVEDGAEDGFDQEIEPTSPAVKRANTTSGTMNGTTTTEAAKETPYKSSFVLPLTALDPSLTQITDLAFLHEYREPTFGILSSSIAPSYALREERQDILTYSVFTLDLEQRASTNLLTVSNLPSDLGKVLPLPPPVGGALLIGTNEVVHIDQSGKTNAVGVNEFAKLSSAFGMADQSSLNLKLEHCTLFPLDPHTNDLLIILSDASMAILSFRLSGRNVTGLSITPVSEANGGGVLEAAPSCTAVVDEGRVFVGSEVGDSKLLSWSKPTAMMPGLSRKRSYAQMMRSSETAAVDAGGDGEGDDEEEGEDEEDDLYAAVEPAKRAQSFSTAAQADGASHYTFWICGHLPSLAPINSLTFGRSKSTARGKLEMLAAVGRGKASRLAFMSREIVPEKLEGEVVFAGARNAWTLTTNTSTNARQKAGEDGSWRSLLGVFNGEDTRLYDIVHSDEEGEPSKSIYSERSGTEFETEGETVALSTLAHGTRIVQCRRSEIRIYDSADLSLSQIIPMTDEETDEELRIVHTSFCDPYLLVLREDSSLVLLCAEEKSGDIEPLDFADEGLGGAKWLSGCLYKGEVFGDETVAVLLDEQGGLQILSLPGMRIVYTIPGLPNLPAVLAPDVPQRRTGAKETLTEILLADIGTREHRQAYLILRSALDDLMLYQPFSTSTPTISASTTTTTTTTTTSNNTPPWTTTLRFRKTPFTYHPKFDENIAEETSDRPAPLQALEIGGRSVVYVHGGEPTFIVKECYAQPKALGVRTRSVRAVVPLGHLGAEGGFGGVDCEGGMRECLLPGGTEFGSGWGMQRMRVGGMGEEVRYVGFHEERGMWVVASCREVGFYLDGEDGGMRGEDDTTLQPKIPRYTLHLLSALTHTIISSYQLPYLETITSLKIMPLEISEQSHEQRTLIVIGTSLQRGEDMPAKGAINIFDILDVVPDPERAESGVKLHLLSREETRGAVTAVESFPGGFVGTGQGQKIMIRGLKEDGSCLPVAFLDAQCYTTQLKTLANTGLWLAADAWKGLWFGGWTEEPYKLSVLGKSRTRMEVVSAEFLPFEGGLFLLVVDAEMDLHVLQFDPENPKSLSGTRLLLRSTMHVGQFGSGMYLLPSTLSPMSKEGMADGDDGDEEGSLYQVLTTSTTGSISLITPLDEAAYRRLGSIETQLTSILEHAAGLNPRAYRAVESEGFGSKGVIDGSLVQRINESGASRRSEVLGRAVADAWALRGDLEVAGGGGLGYL